MSKDNNSNSADKGGVNHAQANADTGANNAAGNVTFALAQSHFLVGDINTNTDKMRKLAIEAREQGADVIIFPELALLGYPPQDLLLRPSLSGRVKSALSALSDITLKGFKPDLTLYLDVEPAVGLERARGRGELDRIELAGLGFFERTRARYLQLAAADSSIITIDAMQPMADVHRDVQRTLEQYLSC